MSQETTIDFQENDEAAGEMELQAPEVFAAHLIEWALERHASDLFVSDIDGAVLVSVRRLGQIEVVRKLAASYGHRLQGHLRVLAGADSGEHIRPVEGRGVINTPDGSIGNLRLSCIPTLFGQDVAIRLFDPVRGARKLDGLGLDQTDYESVENLLSRSSGLILVTGPVASGKSSTLYAMLDQLHDGTRKIHTIEDPIEHSVSGLMQTQVNLKTGLDYPDLLTAVLRHSPDVIMVGEVRDRVTAQTAIRAGASGQLVLATVHANSAAEAIDMMLQYESSPKFLASALVGVINQRLIRKLCNGCRTTSPDDHYTDLRSRGVPERIQSRVSLESPELFSAGTCDDCHQASFDQVIALPEIMIVDDEIEAAISRGDSTAQIEEIATRQGMLKIGEVAHSYVLRGLTTIEEVNRVINDPDMASLQPKAV